MRPSRKTDVSNILHWFSVFQRFCSPSMIFSSLRERRKSTTSTTHPLWVGFELPCHVITLLSLPRSFRLLWACCILCYCVFFPNREGKYQRFLALNWYTIILKNHFTVKINKIPHDSRLSAVGCQIDGTVFSCVFEPFVSAQCSLSLIRI